MTALAARGGVRGTTEDSDRRRSPLAWLLILLVHAYRVVPKPGPPRCRFFPSCSTYALTAVQRHGAVRGAGLAVWRLLRCHPFTPGGVDHVPALRETAVAGQSRHYLKGSRRV